MNLPLYRITCTIPGCGRSSTVARYTECAVWIDRDEDGVPSFMEVCPPHRALFLTLVSEFASGKVSLTEIF